MSRAKTKAKTPCRIVRITLINRAGVKWNRQKCVEHSTGFGLRDVPNGGIRCEFGPTLNDADLLATLPLGKEMSLHVLAERLYPRMGGAQPKGSHGGIAFRAKAVDKRLEHYEGTVVERVQRPTRRITEGSWRRKAEIPKEVGEPSKPNVIDFGTVSLDIAEEQWVKEGHLHCRVCEGTFSSNSISVAELHLLAAPWCAVAPHRGFNITKDEEGREVTTSVNIIDIKTKEVDA